MKPLGLSSLILAGILGSTLAQAGINTGITDVALKSEESCAMAINSYLSYRHEANEIDAYTMQTMENNIDNICIGFQIKLVDNNGVMTGVVEVAD